jgi:hypothetical protein
LFTFSGPNTWVGGEWQIQVKGTLCSFNFDIDNAAMNPT